MTSKEKKDIVVKEVIIEGLKAADYYGISTKRIRSLS